MTEILIWRAGATFELELFCTDNHGCFVHEASCIRFSYVQYGIVHLKVKTAMTHVVWLLSWVILRLVSWLSVFVGCRLS